MLMAPQDRLAGAMGQQREVILKKWVKMIRFSIGMKATKNAATKATYKTVWVAGPSIEHTTEILSTKDIVAKFVN